MSRIITKRSTVWLEKLSSRNPQRLAFFNLQKNTADKISEAINLYRQAELSRANDLIENVSKDIKADPEQYHQAVRDKISNVQEMISTELALQIEKMQQNLKPVQEMVNQEKKLHCSSKNLGRIQGKS